MNKYEIMLDNAEKENLEVIEMPLESDSEGLCVGKALALNTSMLNTTIEKRCILCEEIWHSRVTVGDITDQSKIENIKQERFARGKSFNELVSPDNIVRSLINYCITLQEMSEFLEVTDEFLCSAIEYYKNKYGIYYRCKDYVLCFEPLRVQGIYVGGEYIEKTTDDSCYIYKGFN